MDREREGWREEEEKENEGWEVEENKNRDRKR